MFVFLRLAIGVSLLSSNQSSGEQRTNSPAEALSIASAGAIPEIQHVIWVWFENREVSAINATSAPYFTSFAAANVNFTNFYGVTHPSQPNYLDAFSGSNQGITTDGYCTFPAATDNLAKQLVNVGKSWRVYAQDFPGSCFDGTSFNGGIDGPGLPGQYVRKHNPAIGFESVRLDATQCSYIQPLANFDPTINFAFVVPNMTNDMHDGTTAQGDAFLQAFVPLVTASPDWAHTLLIVTFDEGSTSLNGGGHIYTAAAAPWLAHANVTGTYNHFSMLRTIEEIFGLPYLGSAATATTITELLPSTGTPTPTSTPSPTATATATASATSTPTATATTTPTATATATSTATFALTPSPTVAPTPSATATPTVIPTPTPSGAAQSINLSTRMEVETGNNVLIGGFIVTGTAAKSIALRGIGPSLVQFGVPDALIDPTLELHDSSGALLMRNDNWQDDSSQAAQLNALGLGLRDSNESGIVALLQPAAYTAVLAGKNGGTGVGLVEVYDTNQVANSQLANISTRGFVLSDNKVMIGGFILGGSSNTHVVVRGIGPSLAQIGLTPVLEDPTLELRNNNGTLLVSNDNWQENQASAAQLIALGLAPTDNAESGIYRSLPPGAFTAILAGKDGGTGIGLVEIYNVGATEQLNR